MVAHTYEAGLRGNIDARSARTAAIDWNVGAFHTTSEDDIIHVASPITGRGFFQNAGTTLRQGIEASATYRSDRWNVYASYNYIDATFQDTFTLASPGNPFAVDGLITVTPGNVIPSIPAHRFKAGAEYAVFDNWKVGADLIAVSGQYLRGDETNLNPMLPGYWVVNLHTTYQVSKHVEVFGAGAESVRSSATTRSARSSRPTRFRSCGLTDPRTVGPALRSRPMRRARAKW